MLPKVKVVVAALDAAEEHIIADHWHDIPIHEPSLAAHALAAIRAAEDQAMAVHWRDILIHEIISALYAFDDLAKLLSQILVIHLLARTTTTHSETFCFFLLL